MDCSIRSIFAAGLLAVALFAGSAAQAADVQGDGFRTTMNRVFGPGRWRQTSGYRTPAQEDSLRRLGAGTAPPGHRSSHSLGSPAAPGAYDAVVSGMSQREAAAMLRRSGQTFARIQAEGAHGPEGPHLHIELKPGARRARASACDIYHGEAIYLRVVNGRQNPLIACEQRWRAAQAK